MNLSSSLPGSQAMDGRRLDIARTLAPVTRSIGLTRVARGAVLGFAAGAAVGAALLVVAHLWAFDAALPAAIGAAAIGVLAGVAFGLARWPRAMEAARAADLHFGLDDRLTTALELRGSATPVALLQSRDVERWIDGLVLSRCRERWLRRSEAGMAVLAAVALAGALALGPPGRIHPAAATAPSSSNKARHAAAKQVQKLTSQLHVGLTPAQLQSPAMRKLDLALARLRHQLLHASSPRAALRAISATQQQLRQLAQGLHPVNSRAVAQLNSSLSRYLGKGQTGATGKRSAARSDLGSAQALNRLAQTLSHLTPAQRAAMARTLAQAANANANDALRLALRQAASALMNGDAQAASAALQQAARTLGQSSAAQAAQQQAGAAGAQLNALKNQISRQIAGTGPAPPSAPSSSGQGQPAAGRGVRGTGSGRALGSGKGTGRGRGTRPGQGRGAGQGAGRGRGTGTGRGTQSGRGTGRGQGQGRATSGGRGTAGAHGAGGQGTSAATRRGKTVTVFVPGTQGKGATITRTGPNGAPEPGALVPYQQVVGQYTQSAHQALDRAPLPPSLQGYVRRYFSTLSQ